MKIDQDPVLYPHSNEHLQYTGSCSQQTMLYKFALFFEQMIDHAAYYIPLTHDTFYTRNRTDSVNLKKVVYFCSGRSRPVSYCT